MTSVPPVSSLVRSRWLSAVAALVVAACSTATPVPQQTLDVACAMCVFHMEGVNACVWAAEVQGKPYLVQSPHLPDDHDPHGPDGMCNMTRQAVVAGSIRGDRLVATQFDLLPSDPAKVPASPTYEVGEAH